MKAHNELVVKTVYKRENFCTQGFCHGRMNLMAVSKRDRETLYVAVDDVIYVYSLSQFEELDENKSTREPKDPIRKLRRNWNDSESHTINAIKVGMMGQEEVLVCVDDSGGVCLWYTADLNRRPISLSNDESTWGIALQGPKRLLAVSANSHNITIYNLKANVDLSEDVNDHKGSPRSSTSTVVCRFSDVVELGDVPQYSLVGHSHNIPNISFSPCGKFLVSCSIDFSCRIWNVQTGEMVISRDVSRQWGWSVCFVSTSSIKVAPASSSAWDRPLYSRADLNRPNQSRGNTRQFSADPDNDGDASDVDPASTTVLAHGVSNVRFDHLETEFDDGYFDTTGDDSSDHESDPDSDQEGDSENEIGSIVDLDNGSGNDSHTPMPESMSDEEWRPTFEPHRVVDNDDSGNERNEVDSSPMPRPNAPDVHRHVEHNSFNPSIPLLYNWTLWSSNSPPYSPASPQHHSYLSGMPLQDSASSYHSALQSSTNSALSQPLPPHSNYSRENSQTSQSYSTSLFSREHSRISQLRSSPQYTPTPQQYSPLLSPSSLLLYSSHSPTFSDHFPTSPTFDPTSSNNNNSHHSTFLNNDDETPNLDNEFSNNVVAPSLNHDGNFLPATPLRSISSSMYREVPESSTIDGTSESGYTTTSQYNDAPTSPNHDSSGSRELSSPHSQRNPDHVINSPIYLPLFSTYSPLSPTETRSSHVPQLPERRRRVRVSPMVRRISGPRESEISDDETTNEPVHRTIDHSPEIQFTNFKNFNANSHQSKYRQQIRTHAEELVLFSTQHDLYLLDPKSELRTLDCKRGIVRDLRRGFVLAGHDRLNMVEYIPELSLAIVASQKGKVALVRILRKCNSAGQENYSLYPEKYLPPDPLPSAPLLGMFVVKNFIKGLVPQSCFCRLYLAYMSGEFYCYNIQRSEQSDGLIGLDKILL